MIYITPSSICGHCVYVRCTNNGDCETCNKITVGEFKNAIEFGRKNRKITLSYPERQLTDE